MIFCHHALYNCTTAIVCGSEMLLGLFEILWYNLRRYLQHFGTIIFELCYLFNQNWTTNAQHYYIVRSTQIEISQKNIKKIRSKLLVVQMWCSHIIYIFTLITNLVFFSLWRITNSCMYHHKYCMHVISYHHIVQLLWMIMKLCYSRVMILLLHFLCVYDQGHSQGDSLFSLRIIGALNIDYYISCVYLYKN